MQKTLEFSDLVRLIDERSTAFRVAVADAPSLGTQVPTCPEWTLLDLVQHLGTGRRRWAAIVTARPDATPPPPPSAQDAPGADAGRTDLLAWLAESTQQLLDALREAGPDRGSWTWWGSSQSPQTCQAVARHQLQEVAVHTYDAQLTVGARQPLPDDVALDGVEDFLFTCVATPSPWPHEPATIDYHVTEGRSWRVHLSAGGARIERQPESAAGVDGTGYASAKASASDLVLTFYGRLPVDSLALEGDRRIFDQLIAWDPNA